MPNSQEKELSVLQEISTALLSINIEDALGQVLDILDKKLGMTKGTITILDQNGELRIQAANGMSEEEISRGKYKVGEGVTGKVVESGEPMVIPKIGEDPLFLNKTKTRNEISKGETSFLCLPIKIGENILGAFSIDKLFKKETSFDEDVRVLTIISSMIGLSLQISEKLKSEREKLKSENQFLKQELTEKYNITNIIGNCSKMHEVYEQISQVAESTATVLIRGSSGTGKELVAHAIHYNSLRKEKPFVKVNLAALPETLIETELFGHEKGAFTNAINEKIGRFEKAHGGTIFLDEIGDLSMAMQVKLLRVLQEKEFERVGGTETIKVNVRIVAATNKNLEEAIKENKFREDLYYRLNVFTIYLPPLSERKSDIMLLANHFIAKYAEENSKDIQRISTPAIDMLMMYHWPGNVRELENVIERAVLLCKDRVIHGYHLPPTLQASSYQKEDIKEELGLKDLVNNYEKELMIETLKKTRGNCSKAAKILKATERIFNYKVKQYKIEPEKYK
ncbi:sigma 54-interacting transcriptional regulator [bacterium]|nr:sigma 54-interacting transcriptional regulator [bacterium]